MKAFARARSLIYIEDQYMWCVDAADALASALRKHQHLRVVVVVPAYPDQDGRISGPANRISQLRVLSRLAHAGGDRFAAYHLERHDGTPIYIHAKLCIIDDVWVMAGSDNFNRRSWTHDSELSIAILDTTQEATASHTIREASATEAMAIPAAGLCVPIWNLQGRLDELEQFLSLKAKHRRVETDARAMDGQRPRPPGTPR